MRDVWITLISVGAGAMLAVGIQLVTHRIAERHRRQHLILVMCSILDDFCAGCRAAMADQESEHNIHQEFAVPFPMVPAFPSDVDWTTISSEWVQRFLKLRLDVGKIEKRLSHASYSWGHWMGGEDGLGFEEAYELRRSKCGEFLQEASELSATLRDAAKPPVWEATSDI